tara:strand:- start:12 stop:890 length:879 start_codon:yes stop_codon:yes gene_type:complete
MSFMNKTVSINAEILGRTYKLAKKNSNISWGGGLLIWSSGHGVNIVGTDRHSLLFFHDEDGHFGNKFPSKTIYLSSSLLKSNKNFMKMLLKPQNHNGQVIIEDTSHIQKLARSSFLQEEDIEKVYSLELQNNNKQALARSTFLHEEHKCNLVIRSDDSKSFNLETLRSKVFPKIATQDPKAFVFDVQKIKEVDSLFLKKGKSIKGIKQAVLHFAENGMLCAVKENGFFLTMPIIGQEDSTVKDYFVEDNLSFPGEHIFLNAFSKKKYKEIFGDLVKIFPDLGFENPKEVYSG